MLTVYGDKLLYCGGIALVILYGVNTFVQCMGQHYSLPGAGFHWQKTY